ncbi:MAG: arginine repressor [Clostridia bacterium]|nr:arginine repressor [Clostridia bacterium]
MTKSSRQSKILDIITNNDIETQEHLVFKLKQAGFDVTQATISRDIKELNIVKTLKNDLYVYTQLQDNNSVLSVKMHNLFKETVLSIDVANNLVVVKTLSNCGMSVTSVINEIKLPQSMGVFSSTDAVLIVTNSLENAKIVSEKLQSLIN